MEQIDLTINNKNEKVEIFKCKYCVNYLDLIGNCLKFPEWGRGVGELQFCPSNCAKKLDKTRYKIELNDFYIRIFI